MLGTHPCGYNFIITCFIINELPIWMFILYWVGKRTIMVNGGLRFNRSWHKLCDLEKNWEQFSQSHVVKPVTKCHWQTSDRSNLLWWHCDKVRVTDSGTWVIDVPQLPKTSPASNNCHQRVVTNIAMSLIWFLPDCYPDKIILLKNYFRRFQTFYSSFLYLISILLYELLFLVFNEK